MSTITKTILIAATAALLSLMSELGAAEAAKSHHNDGGMPRSHDSAQHFPHRNQMGMNYRHRRHGIGGIYLSLGAGNSCSYSYGRWQATGSQYWRSRHNACING